MSSTMTTGDVLIAARALIDTPEKWTRGYFARNATDGTVPITSPDAVAFCGSGAIGRAMGTGEGFTETPAYRALSQAMGGVTVCGFNDSHTHAEVLAAFDRAIEAAS